MDSRIVKTAAKLVNYIINPSAENGTGAGFGSNWTDGGWSTSVPSDGGFSGTCYLRATRTGADVAMSNYGWYMAGSMISVVTGDKIAASYYVRPTSETSWRCVIEQSGSGNQNGPTVVCPAGVWTRVTAVFTITGTVTAIRPVFYGVFGAGTIYAGDTVDMDAFMVTRTDFVPDFMDASSPGWSWDGTPYASTSSGGVYYIDKPVQVRNVMNYAPYPNFQGEGTVATGWFAYSGSGTPTGTRSVSGGVQIITATSIVGGNRRFGIGNTGVNSPRNLRFDEGEMIYAACDVDLNALDPGTSYGLYIEPMENSTYLAFPEVTMTSGTRAELRWAVPAGRYVTAISVYMWVKSSIDWTGVSTVRASNLIVSKSVIYNASFSYPYFDGSYVDCQWIGTPNASASVKSDWRRAKVKRWNGAQWVPA